MTKTYSEKLKVRMADGRCAIHGIPMVQFGLTIDGRNFVCGCPRLDCDIQGVSDKTHGSYRIASRKERLGE